MCGSFHLGLMPGEESNKEAQVAELVDALVSGASVLRRAGSSPVLGTTTALGATSDNLKHFARVVELVDTLL